MKMVKFKIISNVYLPLFCFLKRNLPGFPQLRICPVAYKEHRDSSRWSLLLENQLWLPYANHHIHHRGRFLYCKLYSLHVLQPPAILVYCHLKGNIKWQQLLTVEIKGLIVTFELLVTMCFFFGLKERFLVNK